uniref:CAZy families GT2 protein n=1 Tax=uncultured Rhizopus TaxID=644539 RepID=A0A060CPW4_9FUNG|nr:CAZy families GT2 protein [uncultured Rhizopus]
MFLPFMLFCNLHDVSWGTKGDNAPDLGQVNVKKTVNGKQIVEVDLPVTEDDLNIAYEAFQKQLARQREMLRQKL